MISRFARLSLAVAFAASLLDARAQNAPAPSPLPVNPPPPSGAPAGPTAKPDDPLVSLKLPDADLDTILSALEIYTGRTVLRPSQLPTTNYNLKIPEQIPKSQAILAIETVLALNNIGVSPQGDRFLVVTQLPMTSKFAPEMITDSAFNYPPSGKIAAKVFQLDFLRVAEVQQVIQSILNPNVGQALQQLPNANAMLITDSIANLQRVEALLKQLDRPVSAGMKPKFYPIKHSKASDLVNKLTTILRTSQPQLGQITSFNADDRTNQIVLLTDPRQYELFDELIEKLDIRADPNTRNEVIYLNHCVAEQLVTVLNAVVRGQTQAAQQRSPQSIRPGQVIQPIAPTPGAPPVTTPTQTAAINAAVADTFGPGSSEFSSLMTIASDARSNSIVVSGTQDDIRLITDLIRKLDIVLAQVRVEVVVAEVTLDDNSTSGISQLGLKVEGDKLVGFSGAAAGIAIGGADGGEGSFAAITRGAGVSGPWDLAGIVGIGTTPRKNNTTILTVPTLTTSHGKKAVINNGETRPVITGVTTIPGATTGATTSSQVTQQQIGTTLTVTPYIGVDGSVQLDLEQDLTDVTDTVTVDGNTQYVIGTRKSTSYITAKTGEIIVLGGFRKKINSKNTNRLGPIPIIGDLFGTRQKRQFHQELIFFLRPQVLSNNPAVDNADAMRNVDQLPTKAQDQIRAELDPNYTPPPRSILDKVRSK